ncbi:sensor histidine kinase [Pseudorhodoplanes sp.]|uniref:sensor histidine kinase n=1 Tax=Pseudorhodoplanes sp. TaxID=1934341 RepID=UPI003D0B0A65
MSQGALDFAHSERERLIAALKASRAGTWRWNIAEDIVEWDDALCEVYGIPPEQSPRTSRDFLALIHPDDRDMAWRSVSNCIETGTDADYQFRAIVGDTVRWIYDRSAIVRNPDGSPAYMLGACLDVTAQRRVQEERDEALKRQTLLLNELSHRVKNHLAMIVGLLRLKGARQQDPQAKEDFARAIDRVSTIAHLHEQLYRAEDVTLVDVPSYLGEICDSLRRSMLTDTSIVLEQKLESAFLHIDQAVPVGLIVNELVTNAIKYAFEPHGPGRIVVRFRVVGEIATLTISDNGRGLGLPAPRQGVGSRLVRDLAMQIGARLRVMARRGVTCSFRFKLPLVGEAAKHQARPGG